MRTSRTLESSNLTLPMSSTLIWLDITLRFWTEYDLLERDGRVSSGVIWRMHFWLLCTVVWWCWWQECSLLEWCKPAGDAEPDSTVCWRIGAGVSSSRNTSRDAASVRGGKKHQSQVQSYRLVTTTTSSDALPWTRAMSTIPFPVSMFCSVAKFNHRQENLRNEVNSADNMIHCF